MSKWGVASSCIFCLQFTGHVKLTFIKLVAVRSCFFLSNEQGYSLNNILVYSIPYSIHHLLVLHKVARCD